MKKIYTLAIGILFGAFSVQAQVTTCNNFDFETGNFTGWTGAIGDNQTSSLGPLNNIMYGFVSTTNDAALTDVNARHTIITSISGNDPCGGFLPLHPGGNYSVRLGGTTPNYQGEILEQTFTPLAADTIVTVYYAVVLNDGGHAPIDQPYFRIDLLDTAGNAIPNGAVYISATDSGLTQCQPAIFYLPWTTRQFNLSGYIGAQVTLRITAAGCTQSGHYGYAYIDAACPSSTVGMAEAMYRKLQLSPNPVSSYVNITLPESVHGEELQVTVTDCQGKQVYTSRVNGHDVKLLTLDAGSWASGLYTVHIKGAGILLHEKLVKI